MGQYALRHRASRLADREPAVMVMYRDIYEARRHLVFVFLSGKTASWAGRPPFRVALPPTPALYYSAERGWECARAAAQKKDDE